MHAAFVLLPEPTQPSGEAIAAVYAELWPQAAPLRVEDDASDDDGAAGAPGADTEGALSLVSDDGTAFVMLIPEPVPGGEAEENAERSLAFLGQEPELAPHAAHLVVAWAPSDGLTLTEGFVAQSRLLAAVLLATGAVGVYVGAAGATHPAEWYVEVARQIDDPIMLWTGVSHAFTPEERHSFLSFGMQQFGLPELLLTSPAEEGGEALEYLFDLMSYCATSGRAPAAGETVGRTAEERLPVRYEPSPVDPELEVMCVDLGVEAPVDGKRRWGRKR